VPKWFNGFGELGEPVAVPGWSKFQILDMETNVLLTGVPDEILRHPERGTWIGDYKTARFTDAQDVLAPMYEVQLNCYALIAPKIGLGSVHGLGLLYYDLETDDSDFLIRADCLFLKFSPKIKRVKLEPAIIPPLLRKVRQICDSPDSPPNRPGCLDCCMLERLLKKAVKAPSVAPAVSI
jgi:hypothetical protein